MKSLGEKDACNEFPKKKDACNDSLPNFYVPNKQLILYLTEI